MAPGTSSHTNSPTALFSVPAVGIPWATNSLPATTFPLACLELSDPVAFPALLEYSSPTGQLLSDSHGMSCCEGSGQGSSDQPSGAQQTEEDQAFLTVQVMDFEPSELGA